MPVERKVKGYGWRRDLPDPRDRIFNLEHPELLGGPMPSTYSLVDEMPPIYDQMQLGSCTANATGRILQHMQMKQGEAEGAQVPSRLFIYYEERRLEGSPLDQDTGAEVRTGLSVLATEGAPSETEWPYSDANPGPFQQRPPDSAFTDAIQYEAVAYKKIIIGPGAPMRNAILNHYPIAFGFPVPDYFEGNWDPSTQYLPLPTDQTQWIGGHAVVVSEFDYSLQRFDRPVFGIDNSWGLGWGQRGRFYMDAQWFNPRRGLADDLWVVMSVK